MKPCNFNKPILLSIGIFTAALSLFVTACASTYEQKIRDDLPPGSPKGYIEFYCTRCIAGWAIFRAEQDIDIPLGQVLLGRKLKDTMNAPSRMGKAFGLPTVRVCS